MNKILMAAAVAFVASSPLAFAGTYGIPYTTATLPTLHCENVQQDFEHAKFKSESARQVAEQQAQSLCRENKDGGDKHEGRSGNEGSRGSRH